MIGCVDKEEGIGREGSRGICLPRTVREFGSLRVNEGLGKIRMKNDEARINFETEKGNGG